MGWFFHTLSCRPALREYGSDAVLVYLEEKGVMTWGIKVIG